MRSSKRSLQRQISAVLVAFGVMLATGLAIQGTISQKMIVHPIWRELLASNTAQHLAHATPLPASGLLRGWRLNNSTAPPGMPRYFANLAPGYYDEHAMDQFDTVGSPGTELEFAL